MVTLEQAKRFISDTSLPGSAIEESLQDCIDEAVEMLEAFTEGETIPTKSFDRAVLETVSELYHRRNAPNGIYQSNGIDQVVRVARDPMVGAYPILARFMVIGL